MLRFDFYLEEMGFHIALTSAMDFDFKLLSM